MAKKRRKPQQQIIPPDELNGAQVVDYEITTEPIISRSYRRLPGQVKEAVEQLHFKTQKKPLEAIPELLEWIKKYPDVPQFYNYLSVAYSMAGQKDKAEEAILENIRRNPDYLFARLNYAEICLRRHEYQKIEEIFEHKYDLKMLYPKRNRFHITEAVGFMAIMGLYFVETGKRDMAEKYYEVLKEIDPDSPLVKRLRRKLYPGFVSRLFQRLFARKAE